MTPAQRFAVRLVEGLLTVSVAIFASTTPIVVAFTLGMGWTLVLLELAKWEAAAA